MQGVRLPDREQRQGVRRLPGSRREAERQAWGPIKVPVGEIESAIRSLLSDGPYVRWGRTALRVVRLPRVREKRRE